MAKKEMGPWIVGRMDDKKVIMTADGLEFIAQVNDNDSEYDNARSSLLAAAPELLKALLTMGRLYYDSHVHDKMGRGVCAMCEVDAAISKAGGR